MKSVLTGAVLLAATVFGTTAMATTYECKIKKKDHGYIPDILVVSHDEKNGSVLVFDPIIAYFNDEKPLPGRVGVNNAKRVTFKWKLQKITTPGGQYVAGFTYSATYQKANGRVTVAAVPLGYEDRITGFGSCKKSK
ncbi:MAG: hypothetical protein ACWA47_08640 [Brevirhabdus sp.]